ncbi:50S ribosomal protein L29 [Cryomorpha ignava]|uniref:Large ribosomal subunit protein uL29 n=1 Tax=Cryomorpha ignava TaxID=101383 RepID=A0A7K3WPJ0_9FLAO|nr:50S ribosomal protein L29 [Cryomorpha ignava]NEN23456.1 50S ribosomal protein L29 [Cryomorpha ignava]
MKAKEIADLTTAEVKEKIEIESESYSKMRMNHEVSALENPVQIKMKRREIARLKTEMRKRELSEK